MRTYEETVNFILDIPKFTTKNKPEHTRELLQRLGNPQERFKVIHVAGSNGKGSVCAYIDSILRAAGKRTGLFTSPHLVHLEERFAVEGKPCDRELFTRCSEMVARTADSMARQGKPYPTFFEFVFAAGMLVFAEMQVEYAVLETGLGGRLDATNIVKHPILTVITSISLEHTEILGDTIAKIAAEKAGILKAGVPVVYDASSTEASGVIETCAGRQDCPTYPVSSDKVKILLITGKKIAFSFDSGYYGNVTKFEIPFVAPYQAQNAAVAIQAAACLAKSEGISCDDVQRGLAEVAWKGRMQQISPEVYFDGAHNSDGIDRFLEAAAQISDEPGILLFSMVKEKDLAYAVRHLLGRGNWEQIILTSIPGERGCDSGILREMFEQTAREGGLAVKITTIEEMGQAYAYALKAKKPGQVLFCAGSLYLIGALEQIAGGME